MSYASVADPNDPGNNNLRAVQSSSGNPHQQKLNVNTPLLPSNGHMDSARDVDPVPPPSSSVVRYYAIQVFDQRNRAHLAATAAMTVLTTLLMAATPFLFADVFEQDDDIEFLNIRLTRFEAIACFTVALFLNKLLPILRRTAVNPIVSRTTYDALYAYDRRDLRQPHSYHVETHVGIKQDQMITTIMGSADLVSHSLNNIVPSSCELIAVIGVLSAQCGWEAGVWTSGVTLASIAYNVFTAPRIRATFAVYKRDRMNHYREIAGLWTNFESIYYFNTLDVELRKIRAVLDTAQASDLRNLQVPDRVSLVHNIITQGALMGLILYSGHRMIEGTYTIQDLSIIMYFVLQMGTPLTNLGESLNKIRGVYQDLGPIVQFIQGGPVERVANALTIPEGRAKIEFNHVTFKYKEEAILQDVSFAASAGETVALVGITGAGKSTIARLLFRLYDATEGAITINEQDITDVDIHTLRNQLAIVPQNPVLFNDTLRYNIAYGAFSTVGQAAVTDEMIWQALEQAGLAAKVRTWPEGLDKKVGQGALRISGGELLRVAIARALIRNAPIIILDEYTSALDAETERQIQESIKGALANKLKIVIAHRLSTIKDANNIIVLDNGQIREQGRFQELMNRAGLFKQFWEQQNKSSSNDEHKTEQA